MKNTIKYIDVEIYTSKILELADEFIKSLDDPEEIKNASKQSFNAMIKYINRHWFKDHPPSRDDIEGLDQLWSVYVDLAFRCNRKPTLLAFSMLTGIDAATFSDWVAGCYRKTSPAHGKTVRKWMNECQLALFDSATNTNSIGSIFALKACYGYRETAPLPAPKEEVKQLDEQSLESRYMLDQQDDINNILDDNDV